ncbi:MAG: helix-turn-helix transcriptional regulator [Rhizobiales bacterium]|nr:helix-turn-helix transcriptional regulator [Hyphomicrobiales bacterium]
MKLRQVVARNLRILRKQKGLTQEALADQAQINRNYVGQIEREEKSPTIDMIEKLAIALGVDAVAFLTRPQRRRG